MRQRFAVSPAEAIPGRLIFPSLHSHERFRAGC
jgi:hypothetical protein